MSDTMIDRESVIRQLTQHIARADYIETDWMDCVSVPMLRGALALLKEQEPRVLKLEEVMQYIGYSEKIPPREWEKLPLWTESRNGTGVISGYRDVENLRNLIDMDGIDVTYVAYKHWRCWSSYPTVEQRKEVPWDD